jgi:hypothetical protein
VGTTPLFSYTRTSGQVSDLIFGNPTASLLGDGTAALRSLSGLLEDRQWSQQEARAVARIMPWGNAVPIVAALNAMIIGLPEHPRQR